ncbi:MAG TPA: hypothetical protein VF488_06390 [Gemmatimonadaceae bacterium]
MSIATHRVGRIRVDAFITEDRVEISRSTYAGERAAPFGHLDLKRADVDDLIQALQGMPDTQKWQRANDRGAEAGYLASWLLALAGDANDDTIAAQLTAIADAVLDQRHMSQIEPATRVETHLDCDAVSRGPITFDIAMIEEDWSPFEVMRCWQICSAVVASYQRAAAARKGYTRKCHYCECWTVPDGECHLCEADEDRRIERSVRSVRNGVVVVGHLVADGRYVCNCGSEHARGPVNGADGYRCLKCGAAGRTDGGVIPARGSR